ncbi:hypothetical protein ACFYU9_04835 [Streptomyces sp. NPDC004327]|uniref:hypothetical protein n=1 Tax=Streptomyces sp. NPDC004327 TaxID=3364699 RepID=UPI0036C54881
MTTKKTQPRNVLPIQAEPVRRDPHTTPAGAAGAPGVEASKSQCAGMTGPARQMCYAHLYGVST